MFHFYTPWKRHKTFASLTFSGGIEIKQVNRVNYSLQPILPQTLMKNFDKIWVQISSRFIEMYKNYYEGLIFRGYGNRDLRNSF